MSQPRPSRPRGSAVWVGLDDFGDDVVSRLSRWFTNDDVGRELADANKLLPRIRIHPESDGVGPPEISSTILLEGDDLEEDPVADELSVRLIQNMVAELLAAQQSRRALSFADREILVPHIWLVADLTSQETVDLAEWVQRLETGFRRLNVETRVFFLFRHLSWQLSERHQAEAVRRAEHLVTTLVDDATPGRYGFMAYVLTDRDAIGGLYQDTGTRRETTGLAYRFSDFILLTDIPHGHVETHGRNGTVDPLIGAKTPPLGMERAFVAPSGRRPGGWESVPVFASVASNCVFWDGLALGVANAEARREQLFSALSAPVPPGFDPGYPEVSAVQLALGGRWPALDIPRWSPRFWRAAVAEYDSVLELLDHFYGKATAWRHEMLVTHHDRRTHTPAQAEISLAQYATDLDAIEHSVLEDSSLSGFFEPLGRVHDRADANISIRLAEAPDPTALTPMPADEAIEKAKAPKAAIVSSEAQLVTALERKVNPLLLLQVTIVSIAIGWFLLSWILINARNVAEAAGNFVAVWQWNASAKTGIPGFPWNNAMLADWVAALPNDLHIMVWSAVIVGLPLTVVAVFIALRQRIKLERAWQVIYKRASAWRDFLANRLPADIQSQESAVNKASLEAARDLVRRRRATLTELRALLLQSFTANLDDPHAITKTIQAGVLAGNKLSDLQIAQAVTRFKREVSATPTDAWIPGSMLELLKSKAADVAGDPVPNLGDELPVHRRSILTSMPPDGAVRRPPCATTDPHGFSPPSVVRFLSVPGEIVDAFRFSNDELATVLPLPIGDRFYTVVVQSGLTGRNVFSCSSPWVDPDPTPDKEVD